jgi:glucose-6-phosphate dehydrogenase assembly protein OpcA
METHLMATHSESVTDTAAILARLHAARREAADAGEAGSARVATMNFIVFVDDAAHREWVLERALVVVQKHPARLIVLDSTDATMGVEVSTTTRTTAGATIINERVDVGVKPLDHGAIISLVAELTVPEIPLVLWWSGARLLQSRTFSGLAQQAQTVLVDSSGKARGQETIAELGEFIARFASVRLQDLAFMRLAPWQDMIAQFFDDPALREDLFSIDALEIESGSEAEALYLAGWLGSRLSWEPLGRNAFRDRIGHEIPFRHEIKGDQRRVLSVVLRAGDSTYRACISDDDPNVACLYVHGAKEKPLWCVPLQNIQNTTLIERAILENTRDDIFETSLLTVRDLLR